MDGGVGALLGCSPESQPSRERGPSTPSTDPGGPHLLAGRPPRPSARQVKLPRRRARRWGRRRRGDARSGTDAGQPPTLARFPSLLPAPPPLRRQQPIPDHRRPAAPTSGFKSSFRATEPRLCRNAPPRGADWLRGRFRARAPAPEFPPPSGGRRCVRARARPSRRATRGRGRRVRARSRVFACSLPRSLSAAALAVAAAEAGGGGGGASGGRRGAVRRVQRGKHGGKQRRR